VPLHSGRRGGDVERRARSATGASTAPRGMGIMRVGLFVAAVLVLSLLTWMFFSYEGMPLTAGSTLIVMGTWALVVAVVLWLWGSRTHRKHEDST
jgi:protein-S-isoprenylcysteine O-methyltransferase Ste14